MRENATERANILVVDDTLANLRFLTDVLTQQGYITRPVREGKIALTSAQIDPPDLILLDIMMPGMDGYAVCTALKDDPRTRDIPVLFLSALNQPVEKVRAFRVGGVDFITKPFYVNEVLARVETHLTLRQLQRELEQRNAELEQSNRELRQALATLKTLSGLVPICGWCGRKIQDDDGQWVRVEAYIEARSEAQFTHGICPACLDTLKKPEH